MTDNRAEHAVLDTSMRIEPDKSWLGLLLCMMSALVTVVIVLVVATSVMSPDDQPAVADRAPSFDAFEPAAGRAVD